VGIPWLLKGTPRAVPDNSFSSMASRKAKIGPDKKRIWFLCQGGICIFLFSDICGFLGLMVLHPAGF
jgi:hypothetical protein